jgi:hypothetical protein
MPARPYRCSRCERRASLHRAQFDSGVCAAEVSFDLAEYRAAAEHFAEELSREYYRHLAGHKTELEIEPIYARFEQLFERDAVARLRELADAETDGDEARRLRYLLHFAFDGYMGNATRAEEAEIASLEASLEVRAGDGAVPYRMVPIEVANEPDRERRAALEEARDEVLVERLNPLHRSALERSHQICREFGWASYAAAYGELRGVDLEALRSQTGRFLALTDDTYPRVLEAELARLEISAADLRRSDLPRFFRAVDLDGIFPAERLIDSFAGTLAGLGLDLEAQANVHLDTEARPTKSPRAFCSVPRVPAEIYLVIAPRGGRDDYAALFHEGGHTEHYANTDPGLPFEFRHLGDNSVTESFAFLIEHIVEEPGWLRERLGVTEPERAVAHNRAVRMLMLRRYSAKLAYELELHSGDPSLDELPTRYSDLLTRAVRAPWPRASWLADVDSGFYSACYLRAWALETKWRAALRQRFGDRWFAEPAAGGWLRELWREGQRLGADELLAEALEGGIEFAELAAALN